MDFIDAIDRIDRIDVSTGLYVNPVNTVHRATKQP